MPVSVVDKGGPPPRAAAIGRTHCGSCAATLAYATCDIMESKLVSRDEYMRYVTCPACQGWAFVSSVPLLAE